MRIIKNFIKLRELTAEDRYRQAKGLPPKEDLSAYDQLAQYKDDPDVYISFRNSKRISVNPVTKFRDTPSGVYTYPLKLSWNSEFIDHKSKLLLFPFAGERAYIFVIKPTNVNKVLNLRKYNANNFSEDINKLKKVNLFDSKKIDYLVKNAKGKPTVIGAFGGESTNIVDTYGAYLWYVIFNLLKKSKSIFTKLINYFNDESETDDLNINLWNKILNKILGYDYIVDEGDSIIHSVEKIQALFLNSSTFKVITIIDNKKPIKIDQQNKWLKGTYTEDEWKDGTWYNGDWKGKVWHYGLWVKGNWWGGEWKNGIWKEGTWHKGTWNNGTWKNGAWKEGDWNYGTWENGTWENGNWYSGTWVKGIWEDGTWHNGTWLGGTWLGGYDSKGFYHIKDDSPDRWDKYEKD